VNKTMGCMKMITTAAVVLGISLGSFSEEKRESPKLQNTADGPVQIQSETLTVHQKTQSALFSGNVVVTQKELTIRCQKLEVTYAEDKETQNKGGSISRMVCSGSVVIEQKSRKGACEVAEYDRLGGKISCTGNPWVVEGDNRIEGERIDYLLAEDEVRVTRPKAILVLPAGDTKTTPERP
jgi:lipopolysaccharide export system protein LptA